MLTLEQALEKILGAIQPREIANQDLFDLPRGYLAGDVFSAIDLPRFDNSAMDGYAVRAAELATASTENPRRLKVSQHLAAGVASWNGIKTGECARIFTGSPMPAGADAVVMQEDVRVLGTEIEFVEAVKPFENVRLRGEDVKAGERLAETGEAVTTGMIGLLGAAGAGTVPIRWEPQVAILASGNELFDPGEGLSAGGIYESNRAMLGRFAEEAGAEVELGPILRDSIEETEEGFRKAFNTHDVVITSGGVSVGEHDHLKEAFARIGGAASFWKVAIKPGKPFVFGTLNEKFWFGLPGNPVSAAVTFLLLLRPALLKMQGAREISLPRLPGTMEGAIANRGDRRHFLRVRWQQGKITPLPGQGSHRLRSLAEANALLDLSPGEIASAGEARTVLLFGKF